MPRCFSVTHATVSVTEEAVVTSGFCVKCVLTWALAKWRKTVGLSMKRRMKTLSWRKDLKFNDVEVKTLSWRNDLKLNAARCFSGTHATVRVTEEAVVTSGSCVKCVLTWAMSKWRKTVGLSMKRRIKTLSWRKDVKLNAARCFSGTHATVRVTKETFVTSGSRVKCVLTRTMPKWRKTLLLSMKTLVEEGPQIERGTVFLRDTCHREIYQRNSRDKRFAREACFDLGDVEVDETHCDLQ